MTAKSGFYGTDEASYRKKLVPNSDEAYFMQVNKTTGEIEVWNEEAISDKRVGTYTRNDDIHQRPTKCSGFISNDK